MARNPERRIQIYSDFDGTITDRDSIVLLVEEFGEGEKLRRNLLTDFEKGKLSPAQVIEGELASVRVPWEEAARGLQERIRVDPSFPSFVSWCKQEEIPLCVLSSGLKEIVSLFIGHLGVPIFAHTAEFDRSGWRYHRDPASEKETLVQARQGSGMAVFIGDGISDISVLPHVDTLFAKSYLARHCEAQGIDFIPFDTFSDIQERIQQDPVLY